MKSIFAALAGLALALGVTPGASAQPAAQLGEIPIETLAVHIDDTESAFTVIDARMDETGTAAVFFGVIGAVVNSAANRAEDDEKADPLKETAAAIDLGALIGEALQAQLAARNMLADPTAAASYTLVAEIGDWGLIRRAQRPDIHMRVFLKMNLSLVDAHGRTVFGPQREHSVGAMAAELAAFTPDVFRAEIETLAARAGRQVANRMIYR